MEGLVREQLNTVAYNVDGRLYDKAGLENLNLKFRTEMGNLYAQRKKALEPLINEAYEQRERNVEKYLDWYYSLPADYEMLLKVFTGSIENGIREKFLETIGVDVDEEAIFEKNEEFSSQAQAFVGELGTKLEECEIGDTWKWLFVDEDTPSQADPDMKIEPYDQQSEVNERMRLPSFVFPVSGFVFLKVDEMMKRDSYKEELLAPYKERRDEMLEMVDIPEEYKPIVYGLVNSTIRAVKLRSGLEWNAG